MPIVYTAALAACAAAIACVNVSLLALSAPSLSRMITRPGRGFALASCAASATLSYSAVPRAESTLRRASAPSPSCAAVENGESATAREPNATTETSSAPCFAATHDRLCTAQVLQLQPCNGRAVFRDRRHDLCAGCGHDRRMDRGIRARVDAPELDRGPGGRRQHESDECDSRQEYPAPFH